MGGTIIEAIVAGIIAGIIIKIIDYFFQGQNLKVKHIKRQFERELVYRHNISIENKGKQTGRLLDITVKPTKDVKQSYLMVDEITNNNNVAPISVDGKKSRTIWIDCYPNTKNIKYKIDVRYEKSFLRVIYERKKTIWSNFFKIDDFCQ